MTYDGELSGMLPFTSPLTAEDRRDLPWYLEVYGAHSLGDPDDAEAARIAARLPELGKALFDAVFQGAALRLFQRFQDRKDGARLLTVSAEHPEILALPWELLHDSARGGVYLFLENPRISIRRRLAGATGGRPPFRVKAKERLHLLFVVSRPEGVGFLDPRADPRAVLDAVEEHAPGRVTWEFLLAVLLSSQPDRLAEARQLAEEALEIGLTLDPGASEIWKAYLLLADIADQEGQPMQARVYLRLAREAKRNFAGTRYELQRQVPLILATVAATKELSQTDALEQNLITLEQHGWTNLVAAIRRILSGERHADVLCESLVFEDSMIVKAILDGIEDPSTLQDLLPAAE